MRENISCQAPSIVRHARRNSNEANRGNLIGCSVPDRSLVLFVQELNVELRAVDAGQFAAAIGEASRGQQQEELLEIEAFNRALDGQHRIDIRYRGEQALPAPGSVDAHDANAKAVAEDDTPRSFGIVRHASKLFMCQSLFICQNLAMAAAFGAAIADNFAGAGAPLG
jgi:hypothetical protein